MSGIDELTVRVENIEEAIVALVSIIQDTLPPDYQRAAMNMCEQFYNANSALGAEIGAAEFKTEVPNRIVMPGGG